MPSVLIQHDCVAAGKKCSAGQTVAVSAQDAATLIWMRLATAAPDAVIQADDAAVSAAEAKLAADEKAGR